MSSPSTTAAPTPTAWPVLSFDERRVLGVLVEKAKTTPDAYPLTLNALVTGCNQKSNRDPITNLTDVDVEEALLSAQKKGLVVKVITSSGRTERWKHSLYEALQVDKVELSILTELLLRGPQTEGDLRGRVSRMDAIEDLETLRKLLKPLVERKLVVYLTPEGRRGTMLTHGFHTPQELEQLRARHTAEAVATPLQGPISTPVTAPPPRSAPGPQLEEKLAELQAQLARAHTEITELRGVVADLQRTVNDLVGQVRGLKEALGV